MTDEEVEKWLDEAYDELDRQEFEMEEIGLIMHGDRSYYIQYPDEYEKDKRICELENEVMRLQHRLSNCIESKFKVGQEVFYVSDTKRIGKFIISKIEGLKFRYLDEDGFWLSEEDIFATEEEARAKLEEMKNG